MSPLLDDPSASLTRSGGDVIIVCCVLAGTLTQNKMAVAHVWIDDLTRSADNVMRDMPSNLIVKRQASNQSPYRMASSPGPSTLGVPSPAVGPLVRRASLLAPDLRSGERTMRILELIATCCNRAHFEDERLLSDEEAEALETSEILNTLVRTNTLTMGAAQAMFPLLRAHISDPNMTMKTAFSRFYLPQDYTKRHVRGDASETALFNFMAQRTNIELVRYHYRKVFEVPFNSRNKFALTVVKTYHPGTKKKVAVKPRRTDTTDQNLSSPMFTPAHHARAPLSLAEIEMNQFALDGTTPQLRAVTEPIIVPEEIVPEAPRVLLMKGAPEIILGRCSTYLYRGQIRNIDDEFLAAFQDVYETLGGNGTNACAQCSCVGGAFTYNVLRVTGERVLGFAYLELDIEKYPPSFDCDYSMEKGNFPLSQLTFVGLMSLVDPPKETVPAAIRDVRAAGMKVIMVTGMHFQYEACCAHP